MNTASVQPHSDIARADVKQGEKKKRSHMTLERSDHGPLERVLLPAVDLQYSSGPQAESNVSVTE